MCRTVLIVDDHPTFRRFARRLLEDAGFAVIGEADSCTSGLEAARAILPDVILLDILLPDGSGLDVATALAQSVQTATAVILTSSRSLDDLGAALAETPARGFIPKQGFNTADFVHLVERE